MTSRNVVVLLAVSAFVLGVSSDCTPPNVPLDTGCYFFSAAGTTNWWQAAELCRRVGGYLSMPNNAAENEAIKNYIVQNFPDQPYWMGGYDIGHEGEWHVEVTGLKTNFTDWGAGEPSNSHGIENCLTMSLKRDGATKWDDRPCEMWYSYVCTQFPSSCHQCSIKLK